jgi:hypothetical protein
MSPNRVIAAAQAACMVLILPGLLGAALLSNVHDPNLWIGAGLNALIYFGLARLVVHLVERFTGKKKRRSF